MNQIKYLVIGFISLFLISCQQSTKEAHTEEIKTDSLLIVPPDTIMMIDTTVNIQESQSSSNDNSADSMFKIREGIHNLSLQWISWNILGEAEIKHLGDNKYSIVGEQRNSDNSDYLKINGTLKPISAKRLIFEGIVESQIEHLNQGQPCVKEGTKIFESTKNRKYWRMQDMENCEGGMVVDYVDIYF